MRDWRKGSKLRTNTW